MQLHLLITDWLVWFFLLLSLGCFIWAAQQPHWRETWRRLVASRIAMICMVVLGAYFIIGLLDCVHFQRQAQFVSLLDLLLAPLQHPDEKTYSAPFASHLYTISSQQALQHVAQHVHSVTQRNWDVVWRSVLGLLEGIFFSGLIIMLGLLCAGVKKIKINWQKFIAAKTQTAWRPAVITFCMLCIVIAITINLAQYYHIFGTDKIGRDVFYEAIKSIRTGLLIGILTTIFMLPLAILLGLTAGFFSGWVDDVIQYLYTTLSSIPGVLLISASVLVMQVYIAAHPTLFPTITQRADARLLALCFILGITSWASLCRLLRAETLKLKTQEYIQAATVLGVARFKILWRHLLPNVIHIILITVVLDFSGLVLAEAVLSYVGVGVDPTTMSWGNMINSSRLELAREPIVWWPLLAALIFMFGLVLCANLLADALRDALDPNLKEQ